MSSTASARTLPRLARLVAGAGALCAAFGGGVAVAGGLSDGGPATPGDPTTPVSAAALRTPTSCAALLQWYVARNVGDVGPYGWEMPAVYAMREPELGPQGGSMVEGDAASGSADQATVPSDHGRASSATGTNVQEVGVDEPDTVKTDGRLLVRLVGSTVVITDVSTDTPRETARYQLPGGMSADGLLLVGDRVVVTATARPSYDEPVPLPDLPNAGKPSAPLTPLTPPTSVPPSTSSTPGNGSGFAPPAQPVTTVLTLDVADPAAPTLSGEDTYTGLLLSARQYGDVVRVVTSTTRPQLDWVRPGPGVGDEQATARNRALVRESTLDDWLPRVTHADGSTDRVPCDEVYRPRHADGNATAAVWGFTAGDEGQVDATAVTTDSQVVYSSADHLYIATGRTSSGFWRSAYGKLTGQRMPYMPDVATDLHDFALDGTSASYVGSGSVPGTVRDRWSLDEQDGRLRVAYARLDRWGSPTDNAIAVLARQGTAGTAVLRQVGAVDGLGRGEQIKAVRWFGDIAVLVTFRQMDPLYTVDLSDPAHPRAVGVLKVPGYSGYLHPIGDGLLLGIGEDATDDGRLTGPQVAVFDISDLAAPRRVDQSSLGGPSSRLTALDDPRSLTWLPSESMAITGLAGVGTDAGTGDDGMVPGGTHPLRIAVATDGTLSIRELPVPRGFERAVPLDGDRVALVGDDIRLVDPARG